MKASLSAIAALAGSFWLARHEGAWDTYRQPLFLPFLSTAVLMTVFSTTEAAGRRDEWRRLFPRLAAMGAIIQALAAAFLSRDPIYDLHVRDIVVLAVLEGLLIAGAGAATELGDRVRPDTWIRTAWCVVALLAMSALFPRVMLFFH